MFFSTEGTVRIKTVRDSIWCTPIILTLERLRWEDCEFEASLDEEKVL